MLSHLSLIDACERNDTTSAKILIDNKAILNIQNKNGETALHFACWYNNIELVNILIAPKNGIKANLNIQNEDGQTCLHWACYRNYTEIAEILITPKSGIGANLDIQDKEGHSPLMNACAHGNKKLVKMLIDNKAKLDLQNNKECCTALIIACCLGHMGTAKILIAPKNGIKANLDIQDHLGLSALIWVCEINNIEIVKMLIDNKANLDLRVDYDGYTPLLWACKKNNTEIVSYMLEHNT